MKNVQTCYLQRWRPFGTKRHCFHSTGLYTTQVMFRSAFPHLKDSNVSKVPQLFPVTRQCWLWCKVYRSYVTVQNHTHVVHCTCIKWGSIGYTAFLPLCGYILMLQMSTFTAFSLLITHLSHGLSHGCHMVVTWPRRLLWLGTFFLFSAPQWSSISWLNTLQLRCLLVRDICWCRFFSSKAPSRTSLQSACCSLETPANTLREVVSWGRSLLQHQRQHSLK